MKFTDIMADNIVSQPWLLNYELEGVPMKDGKEGTVYTETWGIDDKHVVVPTIMDLEGKGILKNYGEGGPGRDIALKKGWGIPFEDKTEANDFAKWLHHYHDLTKRTKSSYELRSNNG